MIEREVINSLLLLIINKVITVVTEYLGVLFPKFHGDHINSINTFC